MFLECLLFNDNEPHERIRAVALGTLAEIFKNHFMRKISIIFLFITTLTFAQRKIDKLHYAKTLIAVPENCTAKSEYEIIDCSGFSTQWLFLSDEMVKQKVNEQISKQIEQQFDYKNKKEIKFFSQKEMFEGHIYQMKKGTYRIIGFGRVNGIALVLNLGFEKEVKSNSDLNEFEKNFIQFQ